MTQKRRSSAPRFRRDSRYFRILEEISVGDLLVASLISGRSARLLSQNAFARAKERYENKLALERLERCGYAGHKRRNGKTVFFATEEGKRALSMVYQQHAGREKYPGRWDGSWRIISYDFPETERSFRNSLRHVLEKAGFLQIQKSVWVFPYDSPLLVDVLRRDPTISMRTLYMDHARLSKDSEYKKHFGIR